MVRDDNSSLGHFSYPPNDNTLSFNYRDTVNVSWVTFDAQALGLLSLWYWPGKDAWLLSLNTSVRINGSKTVDLAVAPTWYLGQFNMNFDRDDGSHAYYLSEIFEVNHNSSQDPLTWPAASDSQGSSVPEQKSTAVVTLSSQLNASPSSPQTTATPSSTITQASGLNSETVAGISVGSTLALITMILAAIFFIIRNRRNRRRSQATSSGMVEPKELPAHLAVGHPSGAATELAQQNEQWCELSTEQMARRELPAEINMVPGELPAHRFG
ncbi:hypothetical protein MMC29_001315 [Sticta canariensis]|nr:hypothetical protein [Sticta canariensis]